MALLGLEARKYQIDNKLGQINNDVNAVYSKTYKEVQAEFTRETGLKQSDAIPIIALSRSLNQIEEIRSSNNYDGLKGEKEAINSAVEKESKVNFSSNA